MTHEMTRRDFGKTIGLMGVGGALPVLGMGSSVGSGQGGAGGTSFDVERVRRDTPGAGNVTHFNSAGASLPPKPVLDAVTGHLQLEAEIGGYEAADAAASERERT
jgi:hypothetical protein